MTGFLFDFGKKEVRNGRRHLFTVRQKDIYRLRAKMNKKIQIKGFF